MADANSILADWNLMDAARAADTILPCNGSRAWAGGVVRLRPITTAEDIFRASDDVWRTLAERDWQEAFDSHPRLGESHARSASAQSLSWSELEQSAANPDDAVREELALGNREYEARFGRIFLLCATGRSAQEMLTILRTRMQNDPATELREAAEQQRLITLLRLRRWLGMPALTCAELATSTKIEAA